MRTGLILAAVCAALIFGAVEARADLMTLQFEGDINTFGYSSSSYFRDRPETTLSITVVYESDTVGATSPLPILRFDAIKSFSFTIDFPDREDYVSQGLAIGRIDLTQSGLPRIDMYVQGIFEGEDFRGLPALSFRLAIQDGYKHPTSPLLNREANVLTQSALPVGPVELDDFSGGASALIEWQAPTGTGLREIAYFNGTSLTITAGDLSGSDPVPESSTIALLGLGLAGLGIASRRRKARAS